MDFLDLIASDNYIPYNRTLAKQIGVENSIIFGALCGYQRHYKQQEFFREQQNIMEDTCLTEYAVRKAIKELQQLNLIKVTKKGLLAKFYYQINTTSLIDMLSTSGYENDTTGSNEITSTTDNELNGTNNKNMNNKIDNNLYCEIINYLNEKAGTNYRASSKSTQSHINARVKEKYTLDDFKTVIDKKVKSWKGTTMEQYLRPETLFGSKFEGYLNEKQNQLQPKPNQNFTGRDYSKTNLNGLFDNLEDIEL